MVEITILGGLNKIGGNCVVIEDRKKDKKFVFDYGIDYSVFRRYYQWPHEPKTKSDLFRLGILPSPASIWAEKDIDGCFITHIHGDHAHPKYFPLVTLPSENLTSLLERSIRGQPPMKIFLYEPNKRLLTEIFWERKEYKKIMDEVDGRFELIEVSRNSPPEMKNYDIFAYPVSHTCPSLLYGFYSSAGLIVYTGDFRLHGGKGCGMCPDRETCQFRDVRESTFVEFLKEQGKIKVLIVEGTNLSKPTVPIDADVAAKLMTDITKNFRGMVMVYCDPRDIENFRAMLNAAKNSKRTIVLEEYVADVIHCFRKKLPEEVVELESNKYPQGVGIDELKRNLAKHILVVSYHNFVQLLKKIEPSPAICIFTNSEPFDESSEISEEVLMSWLRLYGIPAYRIRVSGHVFPHDLAEMLEELKPEKIVPIHTEDPHAFNALKPRESKLEIRGKITIN
jgi:ribonuclease J